MPLPFAGGGGFGASFLPPLRYMASVSNTLATYSQNDTLAKPLFSLGFLPPSGALYQTNYKTRGFPLWALPFLPFQGFKTRFFAPCPLPLGLLCKTLPQNKVKPCPFVVLFYILRKGFFAPLPLPLWASLWASLGFAPLGFSPWACPFPKANPSPYKRGRGAFYGTKNKGQRGQIGAGLPL